MIAGIGCGFVCRRADHDHNHFVRHPVFDDHEVGIVNGGDDRRGVYHLDNEHQPRVILHSFQ
jgi:hypothetical protein